MPRKARDERMDKRADRLRLAVRNAPYWRNIQEGRAIGYRRAAGGKAGTWQARFLDHQDGGRVRKFLALGSADDILDADGVTTLTFGQAQEAARGWFVKLTRSGGKVIEPITVAKAMSAYIEDYKGRGGKDMKGLTATINAHVLPKLGEILLVDLTPAVMRAWHRNLAAEPRRVRVSKKPNAKKRELAPVALDDAEALRARRSSANRILTVLKAALNLAYADGSVASDDAWRRVLPYKNAESARIRFLTDAEGVRLINAAGPDFRPMITAALLTAARYSELTRLRVADFDPAAGTLHIRLSKTDKARHIMLTDEGVKFFKTHITGKAAKGLILERPNGAQWAKSEQIRPMRAACETAKITPAVGFHILRHTYASRLTMAGVPLGVVATQLGNSEAICAKHYAHLAPGFVAESIRAAFGPLGIMPTGNVVGMA